MQGAQVQSLVKELDSAHSNEDLHSQITKSKKKKKKKIKSYMHTVSGFKNRLH